jgi:O-antigen/teichoic acid export membrane protein
LGSVVGVRLLTQALPPQKYGELALALTAVTLAQQTVLSPLSGGSLRFFSTALESGELAAFLRALAGLLAKATLVLVAGAALLGTPLVAVGRENWALLGALALLYALLSGYTSALDGMQNAARHRTVVAWHDGLAPWLRFLVAVAFIDLLGVSSWAAMLGFGVATAVVLTSQFAFFAVGLRGDAKRFADVAPSYVAKWTARIWSYAWPFAMWGVFSWAQLSADRWALQTFATTREVGLYAVIYQLGYVPMSLASGLLTQLAAPVLFARAGDGTDEARLRDARRLNRWLVIGVTALTGLATGVAALLHEPVFRLLADARYRAVSPLLPWMVLSGGLFAAAQTGALSVLSGPSARALIAPKIVTGAAGTALAFLGAGKAGLPGVVYASVATSLLYCVWTLLLVGRTNIGVDHD